MSDMPADLPQIDLREKLARIDEMLAHNEHMRQQMLADQTLNGARLGQMLADHDRKRQEIKLAPWQLLATGMGTGAALFAAGAAFFKVLNG